MKHERRVVGAGCLIASQQPSVWMLWLAQEVMPTTVLWLFVKARISVTINNNIVLPIFSVFDPNCC